MALFYYKGTDPNPPEGAVGVAMSKDNLAPALFAWMLVVTNPSWLPYLANGKPAPNMDFEELSTTLGITPGSLQYILGMASDSAVLGSMMTVANQFQSINQANAADPYDIPCPDYRDLLAFYQRVL